MKGTNILAKLSYVLALLCLLAIVLPLPPPAAAQSSGNLLVNPSFEEPAVPPGTFKYFKSIPGWSLASGKAIEIQNGMSTAAHGAQLLELDSNGLSSVYQDVATQPGERYILRFAFSPRPGFSAAENTFTVLWDGAQLGAPISAGGTGLSDTAWTYYEFTVTATKSKTRLTFAGQGRSNTYGSYIDDVSLVPETRRADNDSWVTARGLELAPVPGQPGVRTASVAQDLFHRDQSAWYRFSVTPGSQVILTLTDLPANYDLTLFGDIPQAYQSVTSLQDLVRLGAEFAPDAFSPDAFSPDAFSPDAFSPDAFSPDAFSPDAFSPDAFSPDAFSPDAFSPDAFSPDAFSPDAFSPDAFSPDAFSPDAFSPDAFSPDAFSPDAFSSAQTRSLIGVSAFDGTTPEGLRVSTWDQDGEFYVRVRGRNGAFSPGNNFRLQVLLAAGSCAGLDPVTTPSSLMPPAGGYRTIILTDFDRITGSQAERDLLAARLAELAAHPQVAGVVVDVGTDARVRAANQQADASPECPPAKNQVAEAIKDIVDAYRALNPLEYVVIAGGDEVIPFKRYPDHALLASERNYVPPVQDRTSSQASLRLGYVLNQDFYGASLELPYKNTSLPLPGLAVGRLVETPAEIAGMIEAFLQAGGMAPAPSSLLVTGYDFLEDGARQIQQELESGSGVSADTLILPRELPPTHPSAWTADDLRQALLGQRHDLIFLAGHFSASSALAADYTTRLLAEEVAASSVDLRNSIIFSAGCHAGYNIVDPHGIPRVTREPDWAQAFARKQATLIAGTGYQYGDTDFVEYSERLYLLFSRRLRTGSGPVSVGQALTAAKQDYLAGTPQMRGIHHKVLLQTALFGLPMLSVDMPGARLTPPGSTSIVPTPLNGYPADPGATLGLQFADVQLSPALNTHSVELTDPSSGAAVTATYLSGPQGVLTGPAEPVLPLEVFNVGVPGTVLRGVGFRGGSYSDMSGVLPLTGAAVSEIRGVHTPFLSPVFYPIRIWSLNFMDALNVPGGATTLALTPAQYRAGAVSEQTSVQRTFHNVNLRLFYSSSTSTYTGGAVPSTPALSAAPAIAHVETSESGGTLRFMVRVTANPAAGVQEVWVTYTALSGPLSGVWQSLDLTRDPQDSTLWTGDLALGGTPAADLRYMVQAVNGVGLVALNTNNGAFFIPGVDPGAANPGLQPTTVELLNPPASGAYGTQAVVRARLTSNGSPLAGRELRFSLDGVTRRGVTGADGSAQVALPLIGLPGDETLRVSFAGDEAFAASHAQADFTVLKQSTQITLDPPAAAVQYSDPPDLLAVLTARARPLGQQTLFFLLQGPGGQDAQAPITDFAGRAALEPPELPAGSYALDAFFSGTIPLPSGTLDLDDPRYQPAHAAGSLEISPEEAQFTYSGDLQVQPGGTLNLAGTVAQQDDGAPGDLTLAVVHFELFDSTGAQVASLDSAVDAAGNTAAVISGLQPGSYRLRAEVVGGFFASPPVEIDLGGNRPPVCSAAAPSMSLIWPANNKMVPIQVLNVSDPDGDALQITITAIFQDEPVGSGKNSPDGEGVGTSTAQVRAERQGGGNGRVYHIDFQASDGAGGVCTGEVLVGVPHDQGKGSTPVDDGRLYDSTVRD